MISLPEVFADDNIRGAAQDMPLASGIRQVRYLVAVLFTSMLGCHQGSSVEPSHTTIVTALASESEGSIWRATAQPAILSRSTDEGRTWRDLLLSPNSFIDVHIDRSGNVVVADANGGVWRSTDQGEQWRRLSTRIGTSSLTAITWNSENVGVAIDQRGSIFRTTDGGIRWEPVASGTQASLFDVAFLGDDVVWIVGDKGTLLLSRDSGASFAPREAPTDQPLFSISFLDTTRGWAVGRSGTAVRTQDGGESWRAAALPQSSRNLYEIVTYNDNRLVVVGQDGECLVSLDAGATWQRLSTRSKRNWRAVTRLVDGRVILGGDDAALELLSIK